MKLLFTLFTLVIILLKVATAQNVGQVAPDFTLKNLNNVDYKLSENRGNVILVFSIGYSCPFCIASAPSIKSGLLDVFGSNPKFQALVIDTWDGSASAVTGFKNSTGLNANYLQKGSSVASSWSVTYDRLIVIGSDGKMVFKGTRAAQSDVTLVKSAVQQALNDLTTSVIDIKENNQITLGQNFPNPVSGSTNIEFSINKTSNVSIKVTDITGKVVATPLHEVLPAGNHSIEFSTDQMPNGIYFYRLDAGSFSSSKKMIVNK